MSRKTKFIKIMVPFLIIFAGLIVMKVLVSKRPAPERDLEKDSGILVRVVSAAREDAQIFVEGTGTVSAVQKISVASQVSGRVTYVSGNLAEGGFFRENEVLFRIEETDYRLALERAMASKANAEYELAKVESQAHIARKEWKELNMDKATPPNSLVLYEPQLKNAKAVLASASAAMEQAEVNLERTIIRAPFNCRVHSEDLDMGQYVRAGSIVARLSGTDLAEIAVPLPLKKLQWLNIPVQGAGEAGASAAVSADFGKRVFEWKGRVVRSTGEVDQKSRMMKVVLEVEDPYGLKDDTKDAVPPLAEGMFVNVRIMGKMVKDVFVIPRNAFRGNSTVWIMDEEKKLQIRKVLPLRIEKEEVIIKEGIHEGEMIIVTNISGAADGMKLRPIENDSR